SGVEWLGEVPGHWAIARFSRVIAAIKDGTHGTFQRVAEGRPLLSAKNVLNGHLDIGGAESLISDSDHAEIVANGFPRKGDLLLTIVGTIGRACVYEEIEPFAFQRSVCFIRLQKELSPHFFYYFFQSKFFQEQLVGKSKSSAQAGVYMGDVASTSILFPRDENEQTAIVTFLVRETTKLDALVAEQEKLIALLQEKRQAVISHAVTKGLDPNVPMKDSGVEWLGEVPAHWVVCALRRVIAAIEQGWSPECYAREAEEQEWGVLKAGCLNGGNFRPSENKALPPELPPEEAYEVRVGDVLMSRASGSPELVGSTALVKATRERLMLSDKIFRLKLKEFVNAAFFVAALNSRPLRIQIENALSGGNGMANNLPQSSLLTFAMAVPPLAEQATITGFLEQETAKLDTLTAEARSAITLLQERRTALISAAVTGHIDVRGLAGGVHAPDLIAASAYAVSA
ncbi:restriction endonuclease subunit S, partial [Diaphorobacter nitroreducens]|uniref:restriction endonuclease subunit S n=1 Tax=Diaphorobacter nitroreducens TaxID=164759 RepID=UPI0024E1BDED